MALIARRHLLTWLFIPCVICMSSAVAQDAPPAFGTQERAERLNKLHNTLRKATDPASAQNVERLIWQVWLHHGDPKVDELMGRIKDARRNADWDAALDYANMVIKLAPDYAEGWNQRATLYFFQREYFKSLADVDQTLRREPRHFGALAGRAIIRYRQGKPGLAIQNVLEGLKINPHLREKGLLEELGFSETKT